jgi:hypothetical protein
MYTLHCFLGVSNLEHAPVDLTYKNIQVLIKSTASIYISTGRLEDSPLSLFLFVYSRFSVISVC